MDMTETTDWQAMMRQAYTSPAALVAAGHLEPASLPEVSAAAGHFRVRVPRYYAALIDPRLGERCPIRRQALPATAEGDPALPAWARALVQRAWQRDVPWAADAIGDLARQPVPRLTHRYGNRAILHASGACALTCRYCFRKSHLAAGEGRLYRGPFAPAIAYLMAHPEIREVILTGGDPLSLPDAALEALLADLGAVPHLRHLRIHSRMPVTLPARIGKGLTRVLGGAHRRLSLVTHFNHPREWTPSARAGMRRLQRAGVATYNQAVLLRGVNDRAQVLECLCQRLYESGVMPIYLHHPDLTPGTFHFRVSIARGRRLMRALQGRLSGPAVPHYVLDLPGGLGKQPLLHAGVRCLGHSQGDGLRGALWRLPVPDTRAGGDGTRPRHVLYADLSPA